MLPRRVLLPPNNLLSAVGIVAIGYFVPEPGRNEGRTWIQSRDWRGSGSLATESLPAAILYRALVRASTGRSITLHGPYGKQMLTHGYPTREDVVDEVAGAGTLRGKV